MAASSASGTSATKSKDTKKASTSSIGAPSQRSQGSRKGKRAWRKNVDLDDVEGALEEARTEERITGSRLYEKQNDELFQVDTTGDDRLRKSLPKFNPKSLTSARILAQRSAVPAVSSRAAPAPAPGKRKLSYAEKERLLRIGKRARRGPLDSLQDESEFGKGSALLEVSEAARQSGGYDVWADEQVETNLPEGTAKPKPKAPKTAHPKEAIALSAISDPHQGTSYNPTVDAHSALLEAAAAAEGRRLADATRYVGVKEKFAAASAGPQAPDAPPGMEVGAGEGAGEDDEEPEGWAGVRAPRPVPKPKTKQQKAKKLKLLEEKRAMATRIANKRMLASIASAKSVRRDMEKGAAVRAKVLAEREARLKEKLRSGLGGSKLGRHRVSAGEIDVQLGEDLSESLRGLKPEGNLFRDRFLSLQQRGLVEPRALVLGQRRQARVKEYEKHAWKRFE